MLELHVVEMINITFTVANNENRFNTFEILWFIQYVQSNGNLPKLQSERGFSLQSHSVHLISPWCSWPCSLKGCCSDTTLHHHSTCEPSQSSCYLLHSYKLYSSQTMTYTIEQQIFIVKWI